MQKLALTFWLGEMLFFIIIFAPRVFKVLERPDAAKLQASIFPAYYLGGVISGAIFIFVSLSIYGARHTTSSERWRYRFILPLATAALCVFAYSRWSLTPEITALQSSLLDPSTEALVREKFDHLHKLSVQLNGGALLALLVILFLL